MADLRCVGKARCCGVSVLRCGGCGSVAKLRMLRCGGGRFLLPPVPLLERAPLTAGSRPSWTLAPGCDGGGDFGARIFARPVFSGDCCANVACKRSWPEAGPGVLGPPTRHEAADGAGGADRTRGGGGTKLADLAELCTRGAPEEVCEAPIRLRGSPHLQRRFSWG